jgi:hypothetical protein
MEMMSNSTPTTCFGLHVGSHVLPNIVLAMRLRVLDVRHGQLLGPWCHKPIGYPYCYQRWPRMPLRLSFTPAPEATVTRVFAYASGCGVNDNLRPR